MTMQQDSRKKDFIWNMYANVYWTALILVQGGTWRLKITCPPTYPLCPPNVRLLTKCFHPNIDFKSGETGACTLLLFGSAPTCIYVLQCIEGCARVYIYVHIYGVSIFCIQASTYICI